MGPNLDRFVVILRGMSKCTEMANIYCCFDDYKKMDLKRFPNS